tara:strand:+ start:700 stop:1044 length:345 start_codon:yes stop_codon:yes gene_type:complete
MFKLIKYILYLFFGLVIILFLIGIFNPSKEDFSKDGSYKSFTCSLGNEKSKIKIKGNTATETTAAGIVINYSNVTKTDKGAFTLEGSSKQGRAWFIGAISYLLLDTNMIPYSCK